MVNCMSRDNPRTNYREILTCCRSRAISNGSGCQLKRRADESEYIHWSCYMVGTFYQYYRIIQIIQIQGLPMSLHEPICSLHEVVL